MCSSFLCQISGDRQITFQFNSPRCKYCTRIHREDGIGIPEGTIGEDNNRLLLPRQILIFH